MECFAAALANHKVDGLPHYLVRLIMNLHEFDKCVEKGTISVRAPMNAVLWHQETTINNYPTLQMAIHEVAKLNIDTVFARILATQQEKKHKWKEAAQASGSQQYPARADAVRPHLPVEDPQPEADMTVEDSHIAIVDAATDAVMSEEWNGVEAAQCHDIPPESSIVSAPTAGTSSYSSGQVSEP